MPRRTPYHAARNAKSRILRLSDHYDPFERQREFHKSRAKYRLFGGAAGPGKTTALLWEAMTRANEVPGCDTLLLRRTYPELESSLLRYFRRDVPPSFYRSFSEAKRTVTWHNGSTTRFGSCGHESDVYQYQGAEFLFIGVDELTHFTLKQWQFLTSRNRCAVPGSFACMAGATNPGNIGHAWVKALWIDKQPAPGMEDPAAYDAREYAFISARLDDNPIFKNDLAYRKSLAALPGNLRRAFLNGDWDVFAGQYFDVFDKSRHVVRPETLRIEPWWPRWISIDWGFNHPSAVYWHVAIPGSSDPRDPGPRIFTYREFVQGKLSPLMLGQAIIERNQRDRVLEIFLSPDAYAERSAEASVAQQLGELFSQAGLPQPTPANNDRIGGWQLLYQLLEGDRWIIGESCKALANCLPTLVRDDARVEDIRKVDGDDPADSARYGLASGIRIAFPRGVPITMHGDLFGSMPRQSGNAATSAAHEASAAAQPPFAKPPSPSHQFPQPPYADVGDDPGNSRNAANSVDAAPQAGASGEARRQSPISFYPDGYSTPYQNLEANPKAASHPEGYATPGTTVHPSVYPGSYHDPTWDRFRPPLSEYLASQVSATDATSRAIWLQKLEADARRRTPSVRFPRRRR